MKPTQQTLDNHKVSRAEESKKRQQMGILNPPERTQRKPVATAQTPLELHDLSADEMTAHILGYLRAKGYVVWAQDNRGRYNPKTGKWYPHPNNRVGVPDILGYRKSDARFIGVEVKAGHDSLSRFQIEFLNELKEHGGLPFVAYSFEGFVQSFERRGLHKPPAAAPEAPPQSPVSAATAAPDAAAAPATPTMLPNLTATYTEPAPYHHV